MAEIRKIIFIKNAVETLGYFSEQIARELERNGYETCFIDYERMYESMDVMLHFLDREETALVTFNFIGLRGEAVFQTESGRSIWQEAACSTSCLQPVTENVSPSVPTTR